MKYMRAFFAVALLGAAACSSPTEPRLPSPEPEPPPDGKDDQPGLAMAQDAWTIEGVTFQRLV